MTNTSKSSAQVLARWVALGALFAVTLTPLIVLNSFFFPFITGKAFFFRVIVEIAVAAWGVLAVLDKDYRPRFSLVGAAVTAFVVWMFVANLFAVNVEKAFWSNFERMEGWVLLVHLLGLFFAASAVLRVEKKWRTWFIASLCVGVVVSGYALLQLAGALAIHQGSTRIDATLGNSAYLAIYFLFNTGIAFWLLLTEKRLWLKYVLGVFAVLEMYLLFMTETRGTVLGLVGALALAALLTALTARKELRRYAAFGLVAIILVSGGFYLARNSAFVQGNHTLQRVASISLADGQTRFTVWHMAYEGFLERPVVGWGQEGFNYVFNTYYAPSMYQQESWFDRAHNAFLDWLVAGGLPAFVLYISLFGTAVWVLWRRSELSRAERIVLTATLAGYACHNLFVFDNLYSYVYFFAILALIDSQVARPIAYFEKLPEAARELGMTYALPIATVAAFAMVWFINVPGISAATTLITAISPSPSGYDGNIAIFKELVAHPAFAEQEISEQLVSFAGSMAQDPKATDAQKQEITTLAVDEMKNQVAHTPLDAREQLELSYAYRAAGDLPSALSAIEAALKLSPKKQSIWVQAGATAWDMGDTATTQKDFTTAYELDPSFTDLAAYAAAGDLSVGDTTKADAVLMGAFGTTTVDNDVLAVAYYRTQDWPRLITLWQLRASAPDASAQTLFGLAAAYYAAGQKANAIAAVKNAVAKYPEAASAGEAAIAQIEGKTVAP